MENTDQDLALKPSDYLDKVQLNKLSYKDKFHLLQFICKLELQDDAIKDLGFEDGAKMVLYYCDYLFNASWKKDE
jgi:hypothetical protein